MVKIGSGAERQQEDIMLTRFACYLSAQNGDPKKEQIAFAQSYFAIQTRKQELLEERIQKMSGYKPEKSWLQQKQRYKKTATKGELIIKGLLIYAAKAIGLYLGVTIQAL